MSIYAIADLHLSFASSVEKPMDIYGPRWHDHAQRLHDNWCSRITDDDTVIIAGDISWGLKLEEKIITIRSEEETRAFGSKLAEKAKPGMVIALIGDLGTGKTTLTKAIAAALGIQGHITSPTFNIVKEYKTGRLPLYHFDVYRITDPDEMYELGYEEYFYGDGVCVIEWADLIEELLPEHTIRIEIQYGENEGERIYRCTC